jgi:zona occludens toxin (predicted ATPase)
MDAANYTNWRSEEKKYFEELYTTIATELVAEYYKTTVVRIRSIANFYNVRKKHIAQFVDAKRGGSLVKLYVNDVEQHSLIVSKKRTMEVVNTWLRLYPKNKYSIYYTITL